MTTKKSLLSSLYDLLVLALPLSLSRLLTVFASFIAMMRVANLGKEQLAAGSLAVSSYIAILTIASTIFYAIGIRIRYQALHLPHPFVGNLIKSGLWLALLLGIPASFSLFYMDRLLVALGQDPNLVALTKDYFLFTGLGMFPLLLVTVFVQFYLGTGKPYLSLLVEIIHCPLLIIASYGFVSGHFGLPKLGLSGLGLAMLCAHSVTLVAVILVIYLQKHHRTYQLFKKPFFPQWPLCREILAFGLPIGLQFGGELMAMAVATYLMGYFGVDALAALQLTGQFALVVFMVSFALSQALSLKISEALGQKNLNQVRQYVQAASLLLFMYCLPITVLFCTQSTLLAEFYMGKPLDNETLNQLVRIFFVLSAIFIVLDGFRNLNSAALRGFHDAKASTRINLCALCLISLPVSWVLAFPFDGGPVALRVGFLSGFGVAVVLTTLQLRKKLHEELPVEGSKFNAPPHPKHCGQTPA